MRILKQLATELFMVVFLIILLPAGIFVLLAFGFVALCRWPEPKDTVVGDLAASLLEKVNARLERK